jgi:hypothetical protein
VKIKKGDVEILLASVAVAISVFALYFSWQANEIAKQQIVPKVVLISAVSYGITIDHGVDDNRISCNQVIRVSNLGGAGTSISSYQVDFYFGAKKASFDSLFPYIGLNDTKEVDLSPRMGDFEIYLLRGDADVNSPIVLKDNELPIPFNMEAYTTYEIKGTFSFTLFGKLPDFSGPEYFTFNPEILKPLLVAYTFITPSGQRVTTPPVVCMYFKKTEE